MQAQNIIDNLNLVSDKLFKSIENQVYEILDKLINITLDIFKSEPLKTICSNEINGIIIIANSLIIFYITYFAVTQIFNLYNGDNVSNVYKFILKIVFVCIITNSSYHICKEIINVFSIFTDCVSTYCKEISGSNVNFLELKEVFFNIEDILDDDLLSINGMIKGMISFGSITILFNMSIRYVTIIFLIIFSPFAFISLSSNITSGIFSSWLKIFITNLLVQVIIKFIILIPLICRNIDKIMYKIILVGSIYIIYKINDFTNQIVGNIAKNTNVHGGN